jgi:molybdopterin/thiamine biosynthesis adenylyltransferase
MGGKPVRRIRVPASLWEELRGRLLSDLTREHSAFLLAGVVHAGESTTLLAREIIAPPPEAYVEQTAASLQLRREFVQSVLWRCYREGHHLIEAHSHPFARGHVSFSATDQRYEEQFFPYVARKIPGILHASLVLGQDCLDAHIWEPGHGIVTLDEVQIIGVPLERLRPVRAGPAPAEQTDSDGTLDRQVQVFGRTGQSRLGSATIAIVGLGGTGSLICQQLIHLGAGRLVLVDPDRVEPSNLNRLAGASARDAAEGTPKVAVARRYAQAVRPGLDIDAVAASVMEPAALERLKQVDLLIGCVDSEAARAALNWLAVTCYIPCVDCGVGLDAAHGQLQHGGGQVRVVLPGSFCLECIDGIDHEEASTELSGESVRQERRARGYITSADVPAPAVMFLNGTLASLAVQEAINVLLGFKPCQSYLHYDLLGGSLASLIADRRPDCAVCGLVAGAGDAAATSWASAQEAEGIPANLPAAASTPE